MRLLFACLLLVSAQVLSAQQIISYDKSKEVDFSQYNSFRFYKLDVSNEDILKNNQEGIANIRKAIETEFSRRGINSAEEAQLIVNLGLKISTEVQTRETNIREAPVYMGTRNYHWEAEEVVIDEYQAGTIAIDVVDAKENKLVWQGVVQGVITKKQEKNANAIDRGIAKIFRKFPVKPKKKK